MTVPLRIYLALLVGVSILPAIGRSESEHPDSKSYKTSLYWPANNGNIALARSLIEQGADLNPQVAGGRTPLHVAARRCHADIAELFIDKGADVNAKDKRGWTPLTYVLLQDEDRIDEILIAKGAIFGDNNRPITPARSPEDFNAIPAEDKAIILSAIAESTFMTLYAKVPYQGLRESQVSVEDIIEARRWLENTADPVARILAIKLQHAVDSCILNEMFRKERHKHGRPGKNPYKENSLDKILIDGLLEKNEMNRKDYIAYALTLDIEVARLCRDKGYNANDFLSKRVFKENRDSLKAHVGRMVDINAKKGKPSFSFQIHQWPSWTPTKFITSKKDASEAVLPMTIRGILDAKNARLFGRIFSKYGGFADEVEAEIQIVGSKSARSRFRKELMLEFPDGVNNPRDEYRWQKKGEDASYRFESVDQDHDSGDSYCAWLVFDLEAFVSDPYALPRSYTKDPTEEGMGAWLNLPD